MYRLNLTCLVLALTGSSVCTESTDFSLGTTFLLVFFLTHSSESAVDPNEDEIDADDGDGDI